MTSRDFCYWLQGYFEMAETDNLSVNQSKLIQKHLALVFEHEIDPSMPNSKLDIIHADLPTDGFKNLPTDGFKKIRC